jgi:hypothetical protein
MWFRYPALLPFLVEDHLCCRHLPPDRSRQIKNNGNLSRVEQYAGFALRGVAKAASYEQRRPVIIG